MATAVIGTCIAGTMAYFSKTTVAVHEEPAQTGGIVYVDDVTVVDVKKQLSYSSFIMSDHDLTMIEEVRCYLAIWAESDVSFTADVRWGYEDSASLPELYRPTEIQCFPFGDIECSAFNMAEEEGGWVISKDVTISLSAGKKYEVDLTLNFRYFREFVFEGLEERASWLKTNQVPVNFGIYLENVR